MSDKPLNITITPAGNNLLVTPLEVKRESKLWLPDTAKEGGQAYFIVKVGRGKQHHLPSGKIVRDTCDYKPGERVIASKYSGTEVEIGESKFKILRWDDVIGTIE